MVDNSSGGSAEVELNLAPIIDCFTVLITYLLVTASFLTLTALDVSVAATNPSSSSPPPPPTDEKPMVMTMDISDTGDVLLKVSGGTLTQEFSQTIPARAGVWDPDAVSLSLTKIRDTWATLKEVSVNAAPQVRYKDLVNLINETQKTMPKVYISGG